MKIHHLRNATMIIEHGDHSIVVDPMLGKPGTIPPFTLLRYKPKMNPLVPLPAQARELLSKATACLVTHSRAWNLRLLQHLDHLDPAGENFLKTQGIPVACPVADANYLRKYRLGVRWELEPWTPTPFLDGEIMAIPAIHGYGWIHHLMANGAGFLLRLPDAPSIYLSGDTVLTPEVERVLVEERPDIAVVAAGQARLDIGAPLLMTLEDVLRFVELAPGLVVANHLEALNHCPITRRELRMALEERGLQDKVLVPDDGETLDLG